MVRANKQAVKLTDLVHDLLDVTKLQSGTLELEKSSFFIRDLIHECCEQVPDDTCELQVETSPGLVAYADRSRIEQVLNNLINNAIKYSQGRAQVKIEAKDEGKMLKITVSDSGIGIPAEKVPLVFDRFYRVENIARNYAGLGLGLYISAAIIKRHLGEIGVKSEVGVGSSFWFTIPSTSE